jgi:hypothetical protein
MVDARWNDPVQLYEAKVIREEFSNALLHSPLYENNPSASQKLMQAWTDRWSARFGDATEVWIEVPARRVNHVDNPTGHAVLCWQVFNPEFGGVLCFVPFSAS